MTEWDLVCSHATPCSTSITAASSQHFPVYYQCKNYFLCINEFWYYNPNTGRFISHDSYKGSAYAPWTQNLYVYTGNNPVNFIDPTGHRFVVPQEEDWIYPGKPTPPAVVSSTSSNESNSSTGDNQVLEIPEDGGTWIPNNGSNIKGGSEVIDSIRFIPKEDLPEMLEYKEGVENTLDWIGTTDGQSTLSFIFGAVGILMPIPSSKFKAISMLKRLVAGGSSAWATTAVTSALGEAGQMDEKDFCRQMALCGENDFVVEINTYYIINSPYGGVQFINMQRYSIAYNGIWYAPEGITGEFKQDD